MNRACAYFPSWKAVPAQLSLYLVAAGGDDLPTPSAVDSARHLDTVGWSLTRAEISSGAWLVARKIADGGAPFNSPQRTPYLLSPYSISHVAHSALYATHYWLTAVVLRVGNSLFSAPSGMENVGVSSSRRATSHESRVLDGRQEHWVESGENVVGTLKEE